MMGTTTDNSAPLPDEVERLIERKLRLMRRQAETRLGGIKVEMGQSMKTYIVDGLDARKSKATIHMSTLGAYRETVPKVSQITAEWPGAVWEAIEPILDRASIDQNHRGAIARILHSHAWRTDEMPWTARWADAQNFAGTVHRVMNRYGLAGDLSNSDFERQLSLESSKAQAEFANRGRIGLGEGEIALDEYLLAHRANESTRKDFAKDLEAKKAQQIERRDSASDSRSITVRHVAGATHGKPDGSTHNGQSASDGKPIELGYTPYPKAMRMLKERLGATPAELAVWVSLGDEPGCGGITAYLEVNLTANPPKLEFDYLSSHGFDYIAPLMGAWFHAEDVDNFAPSSRYIEYPRLVERWSEHGQLEDVEAYIAAKVREARLDEFHPVAGRSELSWPDDEFRHPPKETTLLDMADVEAVETADGLNPIRTESPEQRRQRLIAWVEEERARQPSGALNRVAEREGVSRQRVSEIIR